ncbi:MAG TPA: type II toxin-antitoxin system HicB family antitoxin [Atribacteraceae bacterium]|nr:type II toxin-antitoxin system HicB family antitoxin [Atribacteraceae bacterium]
MGGQRFLVIIEQDEDGKYVASVPSLPGCHTQADNLAVLEKRVQEAIKLYLDEKSHFIFVPEKFIGIHQVEVQL